MSVKLKEEHRRDRGTEQRAPGVVHESEAQRQYPRVRIPGTVHFAGADGRERVYRLFDISAGGFAFDAGGDAFRVGQTGRATLAFSIEPMGLSLPVGFVVRNLDPEMRRVGCAFDQLGPREIALLRQLITAYLSGEVVTVGDVLTTLGRDNFTKPREVREHERMAADPATRSRAVRLTGLAFLIGVAAFIYAASKLYGVLFITHATVAKVAAPSFTITMPRDGTFFSLVPEDGVVKKGQPLGSFQAAMLDVVQNDPGSLHLNPQQLSELMGETLKGTLSSPCDCKVQQQYAIDSQFINRNAPLMELLPDNSKMYVLARFHFESIEDLSVGRSVAFRVSGEHSDRVGRIRQLRILPTSIAASDGAAATDIRGLNSPSTISDVLVEIEPAQPLARELLDRPADVRLGDPRSFVGGLAFAFSRLRSTLANAGSG